MLSNELTEKTGGESKFCPVVIAPTYNNAATLLDVLDRIDVTGLPLIVVNDGATDNTAGLLESWVIKRRHSNVYIATHPQNRGKAAAMRTGFVHARHNGYTHAVTIDTDGQLKPEEIPQLIEVAKAHPTALVLGRRSEFTPGLPKSNRLGWHTSGLGLWLETGMIFRDSQCGLRAYPLALLDVVCCRSGRFGFETEIIARAVWAGFPIVETPVTCLYQSKAEDRVSHLKPWRDGCKGVLMHWALAMARLILWPGPKYTPPKQSATPVVVSKEFKAPQSEYHGGDATAFHVIERPNGLTRWRRWLDPLGFVRQLRSSRMEQWIAAAAVGYGVFFACMPLGLWVFMIVIYGSKRLHHNLWAALFGVSLVLTPVEHYLVKLAITIAYLPTHLSLPNFTHATPGVDALGVVLAAFPMAWPVGSILLGFTCHWIVIFAIVCGFRNMSS